MERIKMSREDRAKQFAPFDALKGLQTALRLKEYEHERMAKNDLSEEKIDEIAHVLLEMKKGDIVVVNFFCNGYYKTIVGPAKFDIEKQILKVGNVKVNLEDIFDLQNKNSSITNI